MSELIRTKEDLRGALDQLSGSVALVMTMGALHDGHLSLVRAAKEAADHVVVSVFVNPLQFGPDEDFDSYPRQLDADIALLDTVGVDLVFAPEESEMYPREPLVRIDPGPMATVYEGKTRPIHFAGVLQVVHKVLNLVRPDVAFFGQKDAQQLALIRTMVADLDMPVRIQAVPIKREESGLALSSRNAYLSEDEYIEALALNQALALGKDAARHGAPPKEICGRATGYLNKAPGVKLDYLSVVDPETFEDLTEVGVPDHGRGLIITAAWVGSTRLIDNREVRFDG
ncbi:pantoate--beta-alanine ligase [Ancrocorticia populi]|uniref:pantoate--beta-alanine ligase n=1 Tax=Ancrocorticia populi TaxID=2175228 RepID=UPI003F9147A3